VGKWETLVTRESPEFSGGGSQGCDVSKEDQKKKKDEETESCRVGASIFEENQIRCVCVKNGFKGTDAEKHGDKGCNSHDHVHKITPPHCLGYVHRSVFDFFG